MATTNKSESSPPSPTVILLTYIILGCILSFSFGRTPGTLPSNIVKELAPSFIAICIFLVTYSTYDVMGAGIAKHKYNYGKMSYKDLSSTMPEEVYLAQRAQMNQVEQMPVFIVGSLSCALLVDGTIAGVMSLIWVILRRGYASAYRNAVGVPMKEIGLGVYTIPAYFLANGMVAATAVHSVRILLST